MSFADNFLAEAKNLQPAPKKKPETTSWADDFLAEVRSLPAPRTPPGPTVGRTILAEAGKPGAAPAPPHAPLEPRISPLLTGLSRTPAPSTRIVPKQFPIKQVRTLGPGIDSTTGIPRPGYDEYGWPIGPRSEGISGKIPPQRHLERASEPTTREVLQESIGQIVPSTIRSLGRVVQAAGEVSGSILPGPSPLASPKGMRVAGPPPPRRDPSPVETGLKAVGKKIEQAPPPESDLLKDPSLARLRKDVWDDPSLMIDPKFYALHGPQVAGSMVIFLLTGWAGGPLLAATTEALIEAGETYATVRDATGDDNRAGDAAAQSFIGNLAITYPEGLLFFSKGASPGLLKRLPDRAKAILERAEATRLGRTFTRAGAEITQEETQEEISYRTEKAAGVDRPPPQRGTVALLAGLAGGGAGAASRAPSTPLPQQQKALAEARRASGIPEPPPPTIEAPWKEPASPMIKRLAAAQVREAEAKARKAEAEAKIAESVAQGGEAGQEVGEPPASQRETGQPPAPPAPPIPIKPPETPPGETGAKTRPGTEAEGEAAPGQRQPLPAESLITPGDLDTELTTLSERARDIRRRIKAGQQGFRPAAEEATGDTPASYLTAAGGVKFDRSMQGELQDLPAPTRRKFLNPRGTSADILVDRMRTDHPEWGIETESDLVALLHEGGARLYRAGGGFGMEEDIRREAEREGAELDLMGPDELTQELGRAGEQIKDLRRRGAKVQKAEREPQEGKEEEPFDLFYDPQERERRAPHVDWDFVDALGTTDSWKEAGFITPEGKIIDFSGKMLDPKVLRERTHIDKSVSLPPGERNLEHGDIAKDPSEGPAAIFEMMDYGYIRVSEKYGVLELSKAPTKAQEKSIRAYIKHFYDLDSNQKYPDNGIQVELFDYEIPGKSFSKFYSSNTPPASILADIRRFYAGKKPVESLARKFHQQDYDPQDIDNDLVSAAKEHLGTTDDPNRTGFILADGTTLSLGKPYDTFAHVQRLRGLAKKLGIKPGTPTDRFINDFQTKTGTVRLIPGEGVSSKFIPTPAQIRQIAKIFEGQDYIYIDIWKPDGSDLISEALDRPNPARILAFYRKAERQLARGQDYNPRVGEDVLVGDQIRTVLSVGLGQAQVIDPETGAVELVRRSATRKLPQEERPRATGPDLMIERISQRVRQEKLNPEVGDAGRAFIESLQDTGYLDDLALSVRKGEKGGVQGRYQAQIDPATKERTDAVVNVFYLAASDPRVLPHEIAHHLEQFVPEEDLAPLRALYEQEKADYEKRKSTVGRLARAQRGEFSPETTYRYKNFSEYFSERLADLELVRQGRLKAEADASVWMKPALQLKHLLQTWWDAIKATYKGDVAAKIYRNLQLGRYGIDEDGYAAKRSLSEAEGTTARYEAGAEPADTFYSALRKYIEEKMPNRMDAGALRNWLIKAPGVKREEMETTGILEWAGEQTGPVSKQDVLDRMDEGAVKVEVVEHGDIKIPEGFEVRRAIAEDVQNRYPILKEGREIRPRAGDWILISSTASKDEPPIWRILDSTLDKNEASKRLLESEEAQDILGDMEIEHTALRYPPERYSDYWTPGGTDHRELLVTLPEASGYRSSHFDEPNIVVHLRVAEHKGPQGERVLLVDEFQSDWHREGRTKGYRTSTPEIPPLKTEQIADGFWEIGNELTTPGRNLVAHILQKNRENRRNFPGDAEFKVTFQGVTRFYDNFEEAESWGRNAVSQILPSLAREKETTRVPDAPFKKTWHELAMKQAIRYAAENGFDRIAWTTGEQQADRYDLSKRVDSIQVWKDPDEGWYGVKAKKGGEIAIEQEVAETPEKLAGLVGKDLAEKAVRDLESDTEGRFKVYSGLDLKIGGEWAKNLYDRAITNFLNDYAKKQGWGVKVEDVRINALKRTTDPNVIYEHEGDLVHSIAITPEARDQVLYRGQPMFYRPGSREEGESAPGPEDQPKKEKLPPGTKERQLPKSLEASGRFGGYDRTYTVATDKAAQDEAARRIAVSPDDAYADLFTKETWTKPDAVTAMRLFDHYKAEGDRLTDEGQAAGETDPGSGKMAQASRAFDRQIKLVNRLSRGGTSWGQQVQSLSLIKKLSPLGAQKWAEDRIREINTAHEQATAKPGEPGEPRRGPLTKEEVKKAQAAGGKVQADVALDEKAQELARLYDQVLKGQPLTPDQWKRLKLLARTIQVSAPKRKSKKLPDLEKLGYAERSLSRAEGRATRGGSPPPRQTAPRPPALSERVFSRLNEAAEAARARRRERRGQIQALADPADVADALIIGSAELSKKGITFAKWSSAMVTEFGEGIQNQLQDIFSRSRTIYRQAREIERLTDRALAKIQDVEYDVDRPFSNEKIDALSRAYQALKAAPDESAQAIAAQDVTVALKALGKKEKNPLAALMRQAQREAEGRPARPPRPPQDAPAKALARLMRKAEVEMEKAAASPLRAEDAVTLAQAIERLKTLTGQAADSSAAELAALISSLEPPTFGQKIATVQYIAQLTGTKTWATRNPLGNELRFRFDRLSMALPAAWDATRSALTGSPRTITLSHGQDRFFRALTTFGRDVGRGAALSWKGLPTGAEQARQGATGQYEIQPGFKFRGKGWIQKGVEKATKRTFEREVNIPQFFEKITGVTLRAFDHAAFQRAYQVELGQHAALDALNAQVPWSERKAWIQNRMKELDGVTFEMAQDYAEHMTYANESIATRATAGLKQSLNRLSSVITRTTDWGAGNLLINFTKVPTNLVIVGFENSPLGVVVALGRLADAARKGKNTVSIQRALGAGLLGTIPFALGWFLQKHGALTGTDDKELDKNAKTLLKEQIGVSSYQANVDAVWRWAKDGFRNTDLLSAQDGDKLYTFDWAQPLAFSVQMGAEMGRSMSQEEKGVLDLLGVPWAGFKSVLAGLQTVVAQPLLSGLVRFAQNIGPEGDLVGATEEMAYDIPRTFAPSILNQAKQLTDNYGRIVHDPSPWMRGLNRALYRLPIFSKSLPIAYKSLGKEMPKEIYEGGGNTLWHVLLDPGWATTYKSDTRVEMLFRPYEEAGETRQLSGITPRPKETFSASMLNKTLGTEKFKGPVKLEMSGEEFSKWQKMNALYLTDALDAIDTEKLEQMTPEDQAKMISDAKNDAREKAKKEFIQTILWPHHQGDKSVQDALNPEKKSKPVPMRPTGSTETKNTLKLLASVTRKKNAA